GNVFVVSGQDSADGFGYRVAAVGDVNGDGIQDLALGVPGASLSGPYSGGEIVAFGNGSDLPNPIDVLNGFGNGFMIVGQAGESAGVKVSAAGDVNGDGLDDVLLSNQPGNYYNVRTSAYIVYGKPDTDPVALDN